jgi:hypothetical protein
VLTRSISNLSHCRNYLRNSREMDWLFNSSQMVPETALFALFTQRSVIRINYKLNLILGLASSSWQRFRNILLTTTKYPEKIAGPEISHTDVHVVLKWSVLELPCVLHTKWHKTRTVVFWDITPCSPLKVNRCYGGTCFQPQGWRVSQSRNQ